MWNWLLALPMSFLPARWRLALFPHLRAGWPRVVVLTGSLQAVFCGVGLILWYLHKMTAGVREQLDVTVAATGVPGEAAAYGMGVAAFALFALHPATWMLAYFTAEGAVRAFAAAVNDEHPGTLPLVLVDRLAARMVRPLRGGPAPEALPGEATDARGFVAVTAGAAAERIRILRSPLVPDEVFESEAGGERWLEIRSCRPKPLWKPPQIVLHQENFYRLEECLPAAPPRPFRFRLRRLSAGVPGRHVYDYSPDEPLRGK
jgi:hypothetical protein